jgi:cysteine sulfinate desulfinase/cysteine desulfurase-like protein
MDKRKIYYLSDDNSVENDLPEKIYYFDNNSTTLIYDNRVKNQIIKWISCGNPSNTLHDFGMMAHNKIELCHHTVAKDMKKINK